MRGYAGCQLCRLQCCYQRARKEPAAPAGPTSLTSVAASFHRAGGDPLQCCHQRRRKVPAAPAGLTALMRNAETGRCAGGGHPQSCHQRGRKCRWGGAARVRQKGSVASAGLTSPTSIAAPCFRAGWARHPCCPQRVRKVPAAPAGRSSPTCDAAPCPRTGCDHRQRGHLRGRVCRRHRQASPLSRALLRHPLVPDGFAYSAAIGVCGKGQRHQQDIASLARVAGPCHCAGCVTVRAAISANEKACSASRPLISDERCSTRPSRRM